MSVYSIDKESKPYNERLMFLDGDIDIARYDIPRYPMLDSLTKKQKGFFWQPEEIDVTKDKSDFDILTPHEKHIFESNIKRQILLDSVQGRAPSEIFTPVCSVPEAEIWTLTWAFSESVHSYSYTHLLRNVYPNPSVVFDAVNDISEIVECAADISKYYDDLDRYNKLVDIFGYGHVVDGEELSLYEHKKKVWLTLMSVNILEGVRFYVSFACSWSFGERKLLTGNAQIIKLIARDENLHLAGTQFMLKTLRGEDADFRRIAEETEAECVQMFVDAIQQEKDWAAYLFRDGSMIGLNEDILCQYVDYIAKQRMKAVDLPCDIKITQNPLPWTNKWISGKEVQVASQELERTQYTLGNIKSDLSKGSFKGLKL